MRSIALALVLLTGCSAEAPATSQSGETATSGTASPTVSTPDEPTNDRASDGAVAIGERAMVGDIGITPLAVAEDSRCPEGVACVWSGRVLLTVRIDHEGRSEERQIDTIEGLVFEGNRIALASVLPIRGDRGAITPDAYRFMFTAN